MISVGNRGMEEKRGRVSDCMPGRSPLVSAIAESCRVGLSDAEICERFGITSEWLAILTASDSFNLEKERKG